MYIFYISNRFMIHFKTQWGEVIMTQNNSSADLMPSTDSILNQLGDFENMINPLLT